MWWDPEWLLHRKFSRECASKKTCKIGQYLIREWCLTFLTHSPYTGYKYIARVQTCTTSGTAVVLQSESSTEPNLWQSVKGYRFWGQISPFSTDLGGRHEYSAVIPCACDHGSALHNHAKITKSTQIIQVTKYVIPTIWLQWIQASGTTRCLRQQSTVLYRAMQSQHNAAHISSTKNAVHSLNHLTRE